MGVQRVGAMDRSSDAPETTVKGDADDRLDGVAQNLAYSRPAAPQKWRTFGGDRLNSPCTLGLVFGVSPASEAATERLIKRARRAVTCGLPVPSPEEALRLLDRFRPPPAREALVGRVME